MPGTYRKSLQSILLVVGLLCFCPSLQAAQPSTLHEQATQNTCKTSVNNLNLRAGPGTQFEKVGQLVRGTTVIITGRNTDSSWLLGSNGTLTGWMTIKFLTCAFTVSQLPVANETLPTPITKSTQVPPAATADQAVTDATLLAPLDAKLGGRQNFRWQAGFTLKKNEGFQVIFWEPGQNPLEEGIAVQGATESSEATIDLDKAMSFASQLMPSKNYQWGVLLVRLHPPKRLKFLGKGHQFLLVNSEDDDGGNNSARPTIAIDAPPK